MTVAYNSAVEVIPGRSGYSDFIIGNSVSDKVAHYGVTPVVQPAASAQAAVTTATLTAATLAAATVTAYGFTQAQATALLSAQDALVTRVNSLSSLVDAMRTAMVALGNMKGSA